MKIFYKPEKASKDMYNVLNNKISNWNVKRVGQK